MLRRKVNNDEERNTGADRYLITYADLITLLLGLFVILYASSKIDETKYKQFSKAFSEYFKTSDGVLQGGKGVLQSQKASIPEPVIPKVKTQKAADVKVKIETALNKYLSTGALFLKQSGSNLVLTLPEKLLFKSGKTDVQTEGINALIELSGVLSSMNEEITVDGHSDPKTASKGKIESNWQLSVDRALSVGYILIKNGIAESNIVIRGYGAQRPIADNGTEEGRAENRRVEITIAPISSNTPSTDGYNKQEGKN